MDLRRNHPHLCALATMLVLATAVASGCGSSSVTTSPQQPESTAGNEDAGTEEEPKPDRQVAKSPTTSAKPKSQKTERSDSGVDRKDANPQDTTSPDRQKSKNRGGCPAVLSREQCEEVAHPPSAPSTPAKNECPPGLSNAQCKEVAQAVKEGNGSNTPAPDECPPAFSAARCKEFGAMLNK